MVEIGPSLRKGQKMRLLAGTPFDREPHCERCDRPESECDCPPPETPRQPVTAPEKQTLRLAEEKRKHGRVMTVVRDVAEDNDLSALLRRLKTACGAGGTVTDGVLEIQGAHAERVRAELQAAGYRVRGRKT